MKKRLTAMFLSLCLLLTLLPASAFAAGNGDAQTESGDVETYDLHIAGTQVTSENAKNILGNGTVSFDPETSTLTLNHARIEMAKYFEPCIKAENFTDGLTIRLIGYNQLLTAENDNIRSKGINLINSYCLIQGDKDDTLKYKGYDYFIGAKNSNLTIDGCVIDAASSVWNSIVLEDDEQPSYSLPVTSELRIINGADLTIRSPFYPVSATNDISIMDSRITVRCPASQYSNSTIITQSGDIHIHHSTVDVITTTARFYGASIHAKNGDILIENGSHVTAESQGAGGGIIAHNKLTITNSSVTASGKPFETYSPTAAIKAKQYDITASDVTAKGGIVFYEYELGSIPDQPYEGASLRLTPADGTLAGIKVDAADVDGSAAAHLSGTKPSPYNSEVNFTEDEVPMFEKYKYVQIGEHVHTGGTATCQAKAICKDCGREYGEKDPDHHVWNDTFTVEQAPSCTENGYQSIHCQYCSATKDGQGVRALGHSFTHYVYNNDATYAANGTETARCDRCQTTDTREKAGTMLPSQQPSGQEPPTQGAFGQELPTQGASGQELAAGQIQQNTLSLYKKAVLTWKKNQLLIRWSSVNGADGYDIFAAEDTGSFGKASPAKTVSAGKKQTVIKKITGRKVNARKNYKVNIRAFRIVNGKKQYITSPITFYTAGKKNQRYTNARSIKLKNKKLVLKSGKKQKLSASIVKENAGKDLLPKSRAPYLRYESSNPTIAKVNGKGILKAKKKGTCTIYAYAQNGISKKIKVTVR